MIILKSNIKEQFKKFCKENNPSTMQIAVEYFSIFGGLDLKIDTSKPLEDLITKHILKDYKYLRNSISIITTGDPQYNAILTGLALGDRRTNSAFKRANVSFNFGIDVVDTLCESGIIKLEKSMQSLTNLEEHYVVSEKLLFASPFLRFWFGSISPIFQGIKAGDYDEFFKKFQDNKAKYIDLVFEQLSHEFLKDIFQENDKLERLGRYWDDDISLEIIGKTKSGKMIIGSTKYSNSKVKKSELSKLEKIAESLKIDVDTFVLFSKKGFSNELKSLKSESLKLYTLKSLSALRG